MGKKSKTIEAISKIMYDPHLDPGNFDIIFLDSGEFRKAPFTFLRFTEEGFIYGDAFIPGYKIRAIVHRETGEFLVNRGYDTETLVEHTWPELPPFPVRLDNFFSKFELYRYTALFLRTFEEKLQNGPFDLEPYLGTVASENVAGQKILIIRKQGPFFNSVIMDQTIFRGFPSPLPIKEAKEIVPGYERVQLFKEGQIFSVFKSNSTEIGVLNGSFMDDIPAPLLSNGVEHYIDIDGELHCFAQTDPKTKHITPSTSRSSSKLFLGEEQLSSSGWRKENILYLLHDFDYIPLS